MTRSVSLSDLNAVAMVSFDPYGRDDPATLDGGPRPIFYACAVVDPERWTQIQTRETVFETLETKVADAVYRHYIGGE